MKTNILLQKRIMKRIYFIWFVKKIFPYLLIELTIFVGFLYLVGHYVFVSKVLQYAGQILANNSINPVVWTGFAFHIFFKTQLIVQLSVLGSLAMIILMFRNFMISATQLTLTKQETNLIS